MKNLSISVEALKALDAIAKEGSFATAAIALHKVPSSLTYLIKKLEEDLGVELLDRSKKKAVLNEAGNMVLIQGREILEATNRLVDSVKELESGWERKLNIVKDSILPNKPLFDVVTQFAEQQKPTDLMMSSSSLNGIWESLINGEADLVIGGTGEPPITNIETIKIGELECVLAVPALHPLAQKTGVISQFDLQRYPSVSVADPATILPKRSIRTTRDSQIIQVDCVRAQLEMLLAGLAICFLPTHIAKPYIDSGELIVKDCPLASCRQNVYIAWDKNKSGKALKWFVNALSKQNWFL